MSSWDWKSLSKNKSHGRNHKRKDWKMWLRKKILVLVKITKLKLKDKLGKHICNICQIVKILTCKGLLQINEKKINIPKEKWRKAMYRKITQKYKLLFKHRFQPH